MEKTTSAGKMTRRDVVKTVTTGGYVGEAQCRGTDAHIPVNSGPPTLAQQESRKCGRLPPSLVLLSTILTTQKATMAIKNELFLRVEPYEEQNTYMYAVMYSVSVK